MIGFDDVLRRFAMVERHELTRWVENRWVLPERQGEAWLFGEVDIARVELIVEIRREFALADEAVDLVLGLLDQVYGLRRQLRRLSAALETQPAEVRTAITRALSRSDKAGPDR